MKPKAPEYIQLYPTLRCNKSCGFCFNRGIHAEDELSLKNYKIMLDILSSLGIKYIDIMGGEPFMFEELPAITIMTIKKGLGLNISTNGTYIDRLKRYLSEFSNRVNVGISINSMDELNTSKSVIVSFRAITKTLYIPDSVAHITDLILQLKPRKHYLIYPDNLKALYDDSLTLPFYMFYQKYKQSYEQMGIGAVYCGGFVSYGNEYHYRCPAGTTKLGIMPDGSVYPCNLFFGMEEFRLGNILTDDFQKIWTNPLLDEFRKFRVSPCPLKNCSLYNFCRGGCPAHSLLAYGKLDGPDPRCLYGSTTL